MIEASRHVYLATVIDGIDHAGFRAGLHDRIMRFENAYAEILTQYDGNGLDLKRSNPYFPSCSPRLDPSNPCERTDMSARI